jgi:hypothetical protein
LLATAMYAPSLMIRAYAPFDEGYMLAILANVSPVRTSPLDLYHFNDPATAQAYMNSGFYPWWNDTQQKMSLFRPLTSALWAIEFRFFGASSTVSHLHSLSWLTLSIMGVGRLFMRLFDRKLALLSLAVFTASQALQAPATVICNRHTLIALTFSTAAMSWHLQWREDGRVATRAKSIVAFLLGCLASESGLTALAYPLVFELSNIKTPFRDRVRWIAPMFCCAIMFVLFYRLAGYGIRNVFDYVDPFEEPLAYLRHLPKGVLLLASWALSGMVWRAAPPWASGVVIVVFAFLLTRALRKSSTSARNVVLALLAGAVLSLLPNLSSLPKPSILTVPNLGLSASVACVIAGGWDDLRRRPRWPFVAFGLVSLSFAVAHLVVQPALTHRLCWGSIGSSAERRRIWDSIPLDSSASEYVVFGPSDERSLWYVQAAPHLRLRRPDVFVANWRVLSVSPGQHRVSAVDAHTIRLEVAGGSLSDDETFFRRADRPLTVGSVVDVGTMRVRIIEMANGTPSRVDFTFEKRIDDPSIRFIGLRDDQAQVVYPWMGPVERGSSAR